MCLNSKWAKSSQCLLNFQLLLLIKFFKISQKKLWRHQNLNKLGFHQNSVALLHVHIMIVYRSFMNLITDYGHPERTFFQKFEIFWLGRTNWAEILWGILGISGQTISTILVQWVPCPWERVAGSLSYKKLWFLGLKHTTPKSSQNKILAVKNLWNSVRTSVFGGCECEGSGERMLHRPSVNSQSCIKRLLLV